MKTIMTQLQYTSALIRIEKLMEARSGTADGEELEALALMVHNYEEKTFPIGRPTTKSSTSTRSKISIKLK